MGFRVRLLTVTVIILALCAAATAGDWRIKVDPWVLDTGRAPGGTEFLVFLAEQADLARPPEGASKAERGRWVFETLSATAGRSQAPVLAELDRLGVEHRSYWIANMVWVRAGLDVVQAMAEREDVARVSANPSVRRDPEILGSDGEPKAGGRAVEWNIDLVGAPSVWAQGIDGEGVVVAGQDTGYLWNHPALVDQYRGGPEGVHDYNWHDAIHSGGGSCGANSPFPCDDHGHGTHTMGTIVGDDGGSNQIGMAPGARWIGCRNMNQGVGTPATYAECYQWFVAPTDLSGANPDPSKAPDVINNSWGCPVSEGCTDPNVLLTVVQNVRAAGIVTVHSAGNDGSSCGSVNTPSATYAESFSVGATSSSDAIASFSSRGPVTVDGSNRMKPNISAPGVDIRSSTRDGGYEGGWSGTSMAGPHVAGLVALLLSGRPGLAGNVDLVEDIIEQTAVPRTTSQGCGGDLPDQVPNNVYGWGRIDAVAALAYPLDFTLEAQPASVVVCAPADAQTTIAVGRFQAFDEPVTLATENLPAGAGAAFSTNPVTPPGVSTMTVTGTGAVAPGVYRVDVVGTSSPSAIERRTTVEFVVADQAPAAPAPVAPADGATGLTLAPALSWTSPAQAAAFTLEVATDPGFASIVYGVTTSDSQHTVEQPLDPETTYHWRVTATNACGASAVSAAWSFTTRAVPPILLVDDDDNSPDVRSYYSTALGALGLDADLWDTANSDVEPDLATLSSYSTVIWFTGDEFGGAAGPGAGAESALAQWLDGAGSCLLVSAQDYLYDRGITAFVEGYLGVAEVDNDVHQATVTGGGSVFSGLGPFTLSYPFTDYADRVTPTAAAEVDFAGGNGTAAAGRRESWGVTTLLAFPIEALPTAGDRATVLGAFLDHCAASAGGIFADGFESGSTAAWTLAMP